MPEQKPGAGDAGSSGLRVVLDACVLYPTILREILQAAGEAGLYTPLWSERILREWQLATQKIGPEAVATARVESTLFADAFPGGLVPPDPAIENRLFLPDPGDRHVLATAISGRADAILTFNLQDFPRSILAGEGVARREPDEFLWELASRAPYRMAGIIDDTRQRAEDLSGHPITTRSLLKRLRLFRLAKAVG